MIFSNIYLYRFNWSRIGLYYYYYYYYYYVQRIILLFILPAIIVYNVSSSINKHIVSTNYRFTSIYINSKLRPCWREYNILLRRYKIVYTYAHCAKLFTIKLVQTTKTRRKPHCHGRNPKRKFKLLNIFRRKTFRSCLTQNCHEYFILFVLLILPLFCFVSFNSHGRKFKCCLQEMLMVRFELKTLLHCSYSYCSVCIHFHIHIKYTKVLLYFK